jgi:poly(3-hydroxyalkanoate) synthetase
MSNVRDLPIWLQPMATALDSARLFASTTATVMAPPTATRPHAVEWQSANRVLAELTTMSLREFSPGEDDSVPILIEAPFAIHDAGMVDLAQGHSLVEMFRAHCGRRLVVTEWHSTTQALCGLSIDSYLADLNAAVDLLGGQVDLVGLCQGGWMALVYAATFPDKVRRLVLAGAPVDTDAANSFVTAAARSPAAAWWQPFIAGNGLVKTESVFCALIAASARDEDVMSALQVSDAQSASDDDAVARFHRWNRRNFDLPAVYFSQVDRWLFQENRIVKGTFPVFGRAIALANIRCPIFILAGDGDAFAPAAQSLGLAALLATPPEQILCRVVLDCGHLGLFLGRRTLREAWPEIVTFLNAA